jgi:hypothetical protein
MAKAKVSTQSYRILDLSTVAYNGKVADCGDVVDDLPGESIGWLLEGGYIEACESTPTPTPVVEETTPDTPAEGEDN